MTTAVPATGDDMTNGIPPKRSVTALTFLAYTSCFVVCLLSLAALIEREAFGSRMLSHYLPYSVLAFLVLYIVLRWSSRQK